MIDKYIKEELKLVKPIDRNFLIIFRDTVMAYRDKFPHDSVETTVKTYTELGKTTVTKNIKAEEIESAISPMESFQLSDLSIYFGDSHGKMDTEYCSISWGRDLWISVLDDVIRDSLYLSYMVEFGVRRDCFEKDIRSTSVLAFCWL